MEAKGRREFLLPSENSIIVGNLPQEISQVRNVLIDHGAKINMLLFCPLITTDCLWIKFVWIYPAS